MTEKNVQNENLVAQKIEMGSIKLMHFSFIQDNRRGSNDSKTNFFHTSQSSFKAIYTTIWFYDSAFGDFESFRRLIKLRKIIFASQSLSQIGDFFQLCYTECQSETKFSHIYWLIILQTWTSLTHMTPAIFLSYFFLCYFLCKVSKLRDIWDTNSMIRRFFF